MTDQLPERLWVYAEKLGWRAEIAATHKKLRDNQSEYLRADTVVPKVEAEAMVAAALERAAQACEDTAYSGKYPMDDMAELGCLRCRDEVEALAHADARASFEQAVRDAREAGYADGYDEGYSLVGLTTQQAIEKAKLAWALAYLSDEGQHSEEIEQAVQKAVEKERERCAQVALRHFGYEPSDEEMHTVMEIAAAIRAPQEPNE